MLHKSLLFLLFSVLVSTSIAQISKTPTPTPPAVRPLKSGILVNLNYTFQLPFGDLKDRFDSNSNVGGSIQYITKNNFIFGITGEYIFGEQVKEDVLAPLRTSVFYIIDEQGDLIDVLLSERGFYIGGQVGKLFPLSAKNKRSGIEVNLGAGILQHRIKITDEGSTVIQLRDDYIEGYDRLTNGFALKQFVGYRLLGKKKLANFYIGLDFTEGFTQNRRDWNWDTNTQDTKNRFDMLIGIRAGWTLPLYFYNKETEDVIFY